MTNEALALLLAVFGGIGIGVVLASAMWRQKVELLTAERDLMGTWLEEAAEDIEDLQAQIAPFDGDNDGRIGGSKPRKSH